MTPKQFRQTWTIDGDSLSPFSPNCLVGLNLRPSTCNFLTIAGLPFDAAPFLSFVQNNTGSCNTINKLTTYYKFLETQYDKYVVIGLCREANAIAIDTHRCDQIVWLNREDNFSPRFFNSSISSFAECLVIYRDFVQTMLRDAVENEYINIDFTRRQIEILKQKLVTADGKAITENGFWKSNLELELRALQVAERTAIIQ